MSLFGRPPVRRGRDGRYLVHLSAPEREVLQLLPTQLTELLSQPDDPSLRRLFPPAYHDADDAERQADYRRLMQEDLIERHRQALETLARTAGATELSEEELSAWLHSLNSLRLVLGTRLDVSEDDDPLDATTPEQQLYLLLGYLEECVVDALSGQY
ncbi:MAG: DUF2017 family protein [Acidimicrobiales bacterium]